MKSKILIYIGLFMIICSLLLSGCNIYADIYANQLAHEVNKEIENIIENSNEKWKDIYQDVLNMEMPTTKIDGNLYIGTLKILKLDLSLPIMNKSSSSNLKIAPCRYYGSVYTNDMIIAAHNYRSHFFRIHELQEHDQIIFIDIDGNEFIYEVSAIEILEPIDVDKMIHNDYDLTLFTCTVGGEKRIVVRCNRVV